MTSDAFAASRPTRLEGLEAQGAALCKRCHASELAKMNDKSMKRRPSCSEMVRSSE